MEQLLNSTWRCGCGAQQTGAPTSYARALKALREHQATDGHPTSRRGDRIHSERSDAKERVKTFDREPPMALHGPPRPPVARERTRREGLPWLPGNRNVRLRPRKT